jgi:hypothetical protein
VCGPAAGPHTDCSPYTLAGPPLGLLRRPLLPCRRQRHRQLAVLPGRHALPVLQRVVRAPGVFWRALSRDRCAAARGHSLASTTVFPPRRFWQCQPPAYTAPPDSNTGSSPSGPSTAPTVSVTLTQTLAGEAAEVQIPRHTLLPNRMQPDGASNLYPPHAGIRPEDVNTGALASGMQDQLAAQGVDATVTATASAAPSAGSGRRLKQSQIATVITYLVEMLSPPGEPISAEEATQQLVAVAQDPVKLKALLEQAVPAEVLATVNIDQLVAEAASSTEATAATPSPAPGASPAPADESPSPSSPAASPSPGTSPAPADESPSPSSPAASPSLGTSPAPADESPSPSSPAASPSPGASPAPADESPSPSSPASSPSPDASPAPSPDASPAMSPPATGPGPSPSAPPPSTSSPASAPPAGSSQEPPAAAATSPPPALSCDQTCTLPASGNPGTLTCTGYDPNVPYCFSMGIAECGTNLNYCRRAAGNRGGAPFPAGRLVAAAPRSSIPGCGFLATRTPAGASFSRLTGLLPTRPGTAKPAASGLCASPSTRTTPSAAATCECFLGPSPRAIWGNAMGEPTKPQLGKLAKSSWSLRGR